MLFHRGSDEVSVPRTTMRRNTCFMQPKYSYSLGDSFKTISAFHSLTSRLSCTMAICPGAMWMKVVENNVWPCHLSHYTLLCCLWDTVKSSFSVKVFGFFFCARAVHGAALAQSQPETYLGCLDKTVLTHMPPHEGFFVFVNS